MEMTMCVKVYIQFYKFNAVALQMVVVVCDKSF